mmetsp:Transcript_18724/g.26408  ORF Transcript_18724/g.26408 Transcript_18724/m.26408 type:complete len:392 (+) Transcript_18724:64-1239(+)
MNYRAAAFALLFDLVCLNDLTYGFGFNSKVVLSCQPWVQLPQTDHRKRFQQSEYCKRYKALILGTADSSFEREDNEGTSNSKGEERITNLSVSSSLGPRYKIASGLLGSLGLALFAIPDKTHTIRLATKWGGAAGFGLASGVSYMLADAADHNQLQNDTCKRLNLGLLAFSGIGLFSVPGEAAFHPKFGPAIILILSMFLTRLYSCIVSYKGWKQGGINLQTNNDREEQEQVNNNSLLKELWVGIPSIIRGLRTKHKSANGYRNLLLLVFTGIFSTILQGVNLMEHSKPLFDVSLQWSAVSRLCLISTMIFCLKDAAENDRLTSTTSIQLNILTGSWALLVALGSGIGRGGFTLRRASHMAMFSASFLINGFNGGKKQEASFRLTNNNRKQ